MEHYSYIDSLRGFAIFIVVVGHSCEFALGFNDRLFNYMYYSFHMPLFMFISGLVAFNRSDYGFWSYFKQKFFRLLIPFFVIGGLSCLARSISMYDYLFDLAKWGYWFLFVLFFILLLIFPSYKISVKINKEKNIIKDIIIFSIPLLISVICYLLFPSSLVLLFSIKYIVKLYPFVIMGMFCTKYTEINCILEKDIVKCTLLILSIISFVYIYRINGAISIVSYFLVPIIYLFFKENRNIPFNRQFERLGGGIVTNLRSPLFYDTKS